MLPAERNTQMPIKTGQQYIDFLCDGRRLFIDGKIVSDVTDYAPLQGVIGTIAGVHDDQHEPALTTSWPTPRRRRARR